MADATNVIKMNKISLILSHVYVINGARHFKFDGPLRNVPGQKTPTAVRRTRVSRKILFLPPEYPN
jgi:hypothetical protein